MCWHSFCKSKFSCGLRWRSGRAPRTTTHLPRPQGQGRPSLPPRRAPPLRRASTASRSGQLRLGLLRRRRIGAGRRVHQPRQTVAAVATPTDATRQAGRRGHPCRGRDLLFLLWRCRWQDGHWGWCSCQRPAASPTGPRRVVMMVGEVVLGRHAVDACWRRRARVAGVRRQWDRAGRRAHVRRRGHACITRSCRASPPSLASRGGDACSMQHSHVLRNPIQALS
jgi:hypothetical protein